jgi:AraC-like DNA-binding protein
MDNEEYTQLEAIRDLTMTDRAFFNIVRFLDGNTRNHIVAAHLRNTSQAIQLLRLSLARPAAERRENIVMNIPLANLFDPSGNFMRNFLDPVPVVPSREQIHAATENNIMVREETCAVCQENMTCATRIRHCGHCFHTQCIHEWFSMSPRCPVCRHDVRDLHSAGDNNTNDNRMHADEE